MRVYRKIKKCGDIVSVYDYEKGFQVGYKKTDGLIKEIDPVTNKPIYYEIDIDTGELIQKKIGRQNQGSVSYEDEKKIRMRNFFKAKNKIKDLINANAYSWTDDKGRTIRPKFLTLTFKDNVIDLEQANKEYKNFIKRLNYYIKTRIDSNYIGVQYVTVIEFQKRGAIHYHSLLFNMPYIKWNAILDTWGLGGAYIEGFKAKDGKVVKMDYNNQKQCFMANNSEIHNVGAYITKTMEYMAKSLDDDRLKGQKCYLPSRKLKKPIVLNDTPKNEKQIEHLELVLSDETLVFSNTYINDHIGICHYREYNTKFKRISRRGWLEKLKDKIIKRDWGTENSCSHNSEN